MSYVTTDQLAKQLGYRDLTNPRLQTICDAASIALDDWCESHWEPPFPPMIESVALSLAVDLWKQPDATFGIMGLGETGPVRVARDLVMRYDSLLIPFYGMGAWGIA